ncbi:MAG: hypothetical protein ACOY5U_09435 [Pseudomonadota bacterium]
MAGRLVLGGFRREFVQAAFCEYFGIGPARSNLLIALFEAQGSPATTGTLSARVDSHRKPSSGAIQEAIHRLRDCLQAEAIDRGERGYFLTEVGMAECRAALEHMGQTLALVGARFGEAA